ncbi:Uncharacterised protein [Mycobacteroides abscessus subsp. abscessus]|nr:Uncharacterised protein [Mycobacteroides abscessus subsp. abscessus]
MQQHSDEDAAQWLSRARSEFADCPTILTGLDRYDAERQEWLNR